MPITSSFGAGAVPANRPQAVLILGNKLDSEAQRRVAWAEGAPLAAARDYCHFAEVSAKTGEGLREASVRLAVMARAFGRPKGVRA